MYYYLCYYYSYYNDAYWNESFWLQAGHTAGLTPCRYKSYWKSMDVALLFSCVCLTFNKNKRVFISSDFPIGSWSILLLYVNLFKHYLPYIPCLPCLVAFSPSINSSHSCCSVVFFLSFFSRFPSRIPYCISSCFCLFCVFVLYDLIIL